MAELAQELSDGDITLKLVTAEIYPRLKETFAKDTEIWAIYPVNLNDPDAEAQLAAFHGGEGWTHYAVLRGDEVVGTTSYIHPSPENGTVMIGGTYLQPDARGWGINRRMKTLMIDHAFACGFWRVEFTVDTRNTRSMAALERLGAKLEGIMRRNRRTWTGHVRDTAMFSILKEEWPA